MPRTVESQISAHAAESREALHFCVEELRLVAEAFAGAAWRVKALAFEHEHLIIKEVQTNGAK